MSQIADNIVRFNKKLAPFSAELIAVSKTKTIESILEAYETGFRSFGENKVQELLEKFEQLPPDIEWHMIGHLQRNKVKYIAAFVHLIHSIDSFRLLREVNKQGNKSGRIIKCLLQMHIAEESTKFGLSEEELMELFNSSELAEMHNVEIVGLMGMATNTTNEEVIRKEFRGLKSIFDRALRYNDSTQINLHHLSMGMSNDYEIALEEGSTMIRVGSSIFGARY